MSARTEPLLHYLRRLTTRSTNDTSDAILLECFLSQGDETAFAALLARHGPMVLGLCRRILRDNHDAEDAFQATFLVLARKARSLRRPETLASWLYSTASHLAYTTRRGEARRRQREASCSDSRAAASPGDLLDDLSARELLLALDEELARLPETYRLPLILCHLEGHTHEEAARLLGWTAGSVKGRLERGRARLRVRLVRRGLTLGASLLAVESMATATVSAALRQATVQWALAFAAGSAEGIAANVMALVEAGVPSMAAAKVKWGVLLILTLALAGGTGVLALPLQNKRPPQAKQETVSIPQKEQNETLKPAEDGRATTDLYGDPLPPDALARMGTMRFRGIESSESLAYSPDGKIIASSKRNFGPILLWDAATGKELRRFGDDLGLKGSIVFAPDGKLLAVPTYAIRGVVLWEVATGKEVRRLKMQPEGQGLLAGQGCVAFSPNGKILAVPDLDDNVHLMDVATGSELRKFKGNFRDVWSMAFSPDGKILAAGGTDKVVALWETATGKKLRQLDGHKNLISSLAYSSDSKTLASASHDGTIRLWDVATGGGQRRFTCEERHGHSEAQVVLFVPGTRLLVAGSIYATHIWDLDSGREIRRLGGLRSLTDRPLAVSPDGKFLAADAGEMGQIILWDLATGKRLCPPGGHQRPIGSVAFSPDGKTLVSGSWDETLRLWDTDNGKELRRLPLAFDVRVTYTPDGKLLAGSGSDGFIRFWDAAAGKEQRRFLLHKHGVNSFVFAPGGEMFASTGMNWMEFAADGQTLVPKFPPDKTIHLWRVDTGAEIRRFEGHQETPGGMAFAPNGKTLVSVSVDKTARLWDVASGKEVRQFRGHEGRLWCVACSPDGKTVAAAGEDKVIHLWDIATGEEVRRFVGHQNSLIQAVRFSPDGRTLASASHDRSVRLWEVSTGQERHRFEGHRHAVFALDFSRDGLRLASAGSDANILVWDATGRITARREKTLRLTEKELALLWTQLADEKNAAQAYQAMRRLLRDPSGTLRLLREHLHPVPVTERARIARWIADLDSAEFSVREKAMRELGRRIETVEGALRKVLADRPSLEVRQRVKQLLDKQDISSLVRRLRAIELLEQLATAEARRLLEALARGASDARLTQEAKSSLARLAPQPGVHK